MDKSAHIPITVDFYKNIQQELAPFQEVKLLPYLGWRTQFLESIHRICNQVEWLSENLPGNLSSFEWRKNTIEELVNCQKENSYNPNPLSGHKYLPETMKYPLFSALIDARVVPGIGLEQIRAALLVAVLHNSDKNYDDINERIKFLARGIRGTYPNNSTTIGALAYGLHKINSAKELSKALIFPENKAVDFARQWKDFVVPVLTSLRTSIDLVIPILPSASIKNDVRKRYTEDDKDDGPKIAWGYIPVDSTVEIEAGEPPEDFAAKVITTDCSIHIDSPAQMRAEKYQAGQRIWAGNPLLLQTHCSVLPVTQYRQVVGILFEALEASDSKVSTDRLSLLALLISGLTGSADYALTQIQVVETKNQTKLMGNVVICLENGCLYQPMIVPVSAFTPKFGQHNNLEPIENSVVIPLPKRLISLFVANKTWRGQLFNDKAAVVGKLIEACDWLRNYAKVKTFRAEFRKAFAPAIFATCRDVAQVMHICGDTFGLSNAPLYYYTPKRADLAKTYKDALQKHLGLECVNITDVDVFGRVGSKLLVKDLNNWSIHTLFPRFPHKSKSNLDSSTISEIHNQLMQLVAGQFVFILGHRPVNALFELTLGEIDLEYGCAIVSDKKVDTAHVTRLIGMPETVVKQMRLYIAHLRCLAGLVSPLSKYIEDVLNGNKPLLFGLTSTCDAYQLTISDWKSSLNLKKSTPPLNLGRTFIRTYGAEDGADPEALSIQLGHLEAVGYPFSAESPTEPLAFLESINPILEKISNRMGWRLRTGLQNTSDSNEIPYKTLANWDKQIAANAEDTRKLQSYYRQVIRSKLRSYRSDAKSIVIEIIGQTNLGLANAISNWPSPISNEVNEPTDTQIALWARLVSVNSDNDAVLSIACTRELWLSLYKVKKRKNWTLKLPLAKMDVSRPKDSPFIPGMMDAIRQIRLIRQGIEKKYLKLKSNNMVDDFARVAIVLVVVGYVESIDEVIGILKYRSQARPILTMDGYLLVPHGSRPEQVTGLYGLAAISLAWLAKKYPNQVLPESAELEASVAKALPVELYARRQSALTDLCSTMSVANRIELSPMSRMALDRKNGCKDAPMNQQIAFLENQNVNFTGEDTEVEIKNESFQIKLKNEKGIKTNWKVSYQRLIDLIPSTYRDAAYPEANHLVLKEQSNAKIGRDSTIRALEYFVQNAHENRNVRAMAIWVKDMLVNGTDRKQNPAYSTVLTYLSSIAKPLMFACNGVAITEISDTEFEAIYVDVIETKPRNDQSVTARSLWNFHESIIATLNAPIIDFSVLAIYMTDKIVSVDNQLITRNQVDRSIERVLNDIQQITEGQISGDGLLDRRILNQVSVHLITKEATGGRVGEIIGSKLADIAVNDRSIVLNVGSNNHRRLKTTAAHRKIEFSHRLRPQFQNHISSWLRAEAATLPKTRRNQAYLMGEAGNRSSLIHRNKVNLMAAQYLRLETGRLTERQHRIRHLVVQESIAQLSIHPMIIAKLGHIYSMLGQVDVPLNGLLLPWHLQSQAEVFGHRLATTAFKSYFHFSWITRSRSDVRISGLVNRIGLSNIFGVTLGAVDKMLKGLSVDDRLPQILVKLMPRIKQGSIEKVGESIEVIGLNDSNVKQVIKLRTLFDFFKEVGKRRDAVSAGLSYGFRIDDVHRIMTEAKFLKARSGINLIPESNNKNSINAMRDIKEFFDLNILFDWVENSDDQIDSADVLKLVNEYFEWNKYSPREAMRFRIKDKLLLQKIFGKLGYNVEIQVNCAEELFFRANIVKSGQKIHANQYIRRIFAVINVGLRL